MNAGISGPKSAPIGEVDAEAFADVMLVNALAPLRIIDRLAFLVPHSGMIAVMSSGLASLADNDTGGWEAYRMSKAALNMGLRSLAVRRATEGRTYIAAAPGWVQTDMGGDGATLTVDQSVEGVAEMLERRMGTGGVAFVSYDGDDCNGDERPRARADVRRQLSKTPRSFDEDAKRSKPSPIAIWQQRRTGGMKFDSVIHSGKKTATGIEVPPDVIDRLNAGRKPAVSISVNGYSYRTTVGSMGGKFLIPLSAEHREKSGLKAGEAVTVEIALDTEPREIHAPAE